MTCTDAAVVRIILDHPAAHATRVSTGARADVPGPGAVTS